MTIAEILHKYDDANQKKFYDHEFRAELQQVDEAEKATDVYRFEMLAFSLVGNGSDTPWGTYYGPMVTGKAEDGSPVYFPGREEITNDAVLYWESRIPQTYNPLMKMQYAGCVWDFKKLVCSDKYPHTLYPEYVDSMINVINGDYEPHDVITVNVIERLDSFIKKDISRKDDIKNALLRFDNERTGEDASARLWGAYLGFITRRKDWFTKDEELDCVKKHEERLVRLQSPTKNNPWAVAEQSKALADYYKSRGRIEDAKRVLGVMEQSYRAAKSSMTGLQWMGNLEHVASIYAAYGFEAERSRLLKEIEDAGRKALPEFNKQSIEYTIPQEAYQDLDKKLLTGGVDLQFEKFCLYFIPNKDQQGYELKRLANQYPFAFMMPTRLMDPIGRPASVVGGIDNDFEGQLVLHVCRHIQIQSVFIRYAIKKLRETKALSVDYLMDRIRHTPIIDVNRHEIIRQALLAYESDNYIAMCHLIVPQIEEAFRALIDKSGKAVIRPQKSQNNNGFTQRVLDDILRDSVVVDTFGEDIAFYARLLLTDQRGLNIRNNLCHGLVEPAFFNSIIADRLFHLFCLITLVRYQ